MFTVLSPHFAASVSPPLPPCSLSPSLSLSLAFGSTLWLPSGLRTHNVDTVRLSRRWLVGHRLRKGWPRREPRNIILRMQRWLTAFVFHVKNFKLASNLLLYCMCLVQVLFSFSRHRRWHGIGCRKTGCREPTVDAAPLQVGSQPTFTSAYFSTKLAPPGNQVELVA